MSRTSTIILLGIFIILVPFTGFPINIRSLLEVVCGICVLGIGFLQRTREARAVRTRVEDLASFAKVSSQDSTPTISAI